MSVLEFKDLTVGFRSEGRIAEAVKRAAIDCQFPAAEGLVFFDGGHVERHGGTLRRVEQVVKEMERVKKEQETQQRFRFILSRRQRRRNDVGTAVLGRI